MRIGICIGILLMCLVPTEVHNQIRSTGLKIASALFAKLTDLSVKEQEFDVIKVPKKNTNNETQDNNRRRAYE
jgi:hypothetical protein